MKKIHVFNLCTLRCPLWLILHNESYTLHAQSSFHNEKLIPVASIGERAHMRADGFAERREVVSTLQTRHEPSVAYLARPRFHRAREMSEIVVFQHQLTERIAFVRVESGGDDHKVGAKLSPDLL